jgi:hypothetical protein
MATGHVSPKKMLKDLSLRELSLWAALWEIDPWSRERVDLGPAIVAYVMAETKRNHKARSSPYRPIDFMPYALKDKNAKNKDLSARFKAAFKGK